MSVYVRVGDMHVGGTHGLCGTFDYDPDNDFYSSNNIVENTACSFAASWSFDCPEDTTCVNYTSEVCPGISHSHLDIKEMMSLQVLLKHCDREAWAIEKCSKLQDPQIFGECHPHIDPSLYVMDCRIEAMGCAFGGDCECLCTAVARYARDCCMLHSVCVPWRDRYFCR